MKVSISEVVVSLPTLTLRAFTAMPRVTPDASSMGEGLHQEVVYHDCVVSSSIK